jgi:hypothetical protein
VPNLLERIASMHHTMRDKREVRSLYDCYVDACRRQLAQQHALSDGQIEKIIRK